ncbi:MAG: hypothetical protein KUG81_07620 [Gammaproteobacteria bacterium]|nr:hypothetical protein [Gammaproteobacteria bacterium]
MKPEFKTNIVKNKSLTYLLPLIHAEVKFDFFQFLSNTYASFEEGDEEFCVMYKWSSSPAFLKYEGMLMKHPLYSGHSDFGETVVYKFKLTHSMKKARALFLEGKYDEFTHAHKDAIMAYLSERGFNNGSRIRKILTKKESLSSTPPELENEVVMNHIKELTIKPSGFV